MKYFVNEDCIGCGMCASICPEVFQMTDEGVAQAYEEATLPQTQDTAQQAQSDCPVSAIESQE